MDQLVVLQEIYASFSKGGDGLQEISNKVIEGSCHDLMGRLLDSTRKGRIDEDACRELSLKLQDVYEMKRLGDICRKAGLHSLAIGTYKRALSLGSDPLLRPVLQNNLGQAYASQGDLAKAVFYYRKAADCFAREGDHASLAHVLGNLGSAYRRSGEWDKAVEHCYKSLKTFEEKGDDLGTAQMTGSLGRIYADMGEQELAARYFEKSLADFQRLGDKRSAAWVQDRLGRIAGEKKDWDRALCYFHQSLSLFEELGQESSQGLVLANIGSLYLQMGEAGAAREPLERATLLISRQMKPNYPNSLYSLAKTYSNLAKNCLQEALNVEGAGDGEHTKNSEQHSRDLSAGQKLRLEASRLFARASDSYQELASTRDSDRNQIKVEAAMARCRSYLARLCGQVSDEEALSLAERALATLDIAAAHAGDDGKAGILGLQRTISGMKEARCIGLLGNEPSMQARALTDAGEYLMGGAREWGSDEAGGFLCIALKNINAGIQARISGRNPAEELLAGAAALRQVQEHARAAEKGGEESSTGMIAGAAKILEEAAKGFAGEVREAETPSAGGRELDFQREKEALLLLASAMASDSLSRIEDSDSLNAMLGAEKVESPVQIDINDLRAEPEADPIAKTDLPALEISEERCEAKDLILADGTLEASESASETADSGKGWMAPIKADMACRSYCQLLLPPKREQYNVLTHAPLQSVDKFEASANEPGEGTFDKDRNEPQEIGIEDRIEDEIDDEIEDTGQIFSESVPDPAGTAEDARKSSFSQSRAIFLLKALTVLTVMLLAIEAILYLI